MSNRIWAVSGQDPGSSVIWLGQSKSSVSVDHKEDPGPPFKIPEGLLFSPSAGNLLGRSLWFQFNYLFFFFKKKKEKKIKNWWLPAWDKPQDPTKIPRCCHGRLRSGFKRITCEEHYEKGQEETKTEENQNIAEVSHGCLLLIECSIVVIPTSPTYSGFLCPIRLSGSKSLCFLRKGII